MTEEERKFYEALSDAGSQRSEKEMIRIYNKPEFATKAEFMKKFRLFFDTQTHSICMGKKWKKKSISFPVVEWKPDRFQQITYIYIDEGGERCELLIDDKKVKIKDKDGIREIKLEG